MILFFLALVHHHKFVFVITSLVSDEQMGSSSPPIEKNVNRGSYEDEDEFMTPDSDQRGKRKQSGSAEDYNESNRGKRVLPTRSDVWSHFKRLEDNRDKCMCNYCLKHFTCPTKSGTTNLHNHLQSCKQYKAWQDGQDHGKSQHGLNKEGGLKSFKVPETVFREATNEMIVISELPLSFTESVGWKHFCDKVSDKQLFLLMCLRIKCTSNNICYVYGLCLGEFV